MFRHPILKTALFASTVVAALAASASAQTYERAGEASYRPNSDEEIIVNAPRYRPERSAIGAPIENVATTEAVRFDDLDLRTPQGARELHRRVRFTAHELCRELDARYPFSASDNPPCYDRAVRDAMAQADDAIAHERETE